MKNFLVCDLDDCLIQTDLLYEQWFQLVKLRPLKACTSLFLVFAGKARFKAHIAKALPLDATALPYRQNVLDYLKKQKSLGESNFILASASPLVWAEAVSQHLGLFDHVLGSSETNNLRGSAKLNAIRELTGSSPFTYVGDHLVDLEIWSSASNIVAVNATSSLKEKINILKKPTEYLHDFKKSVLRLLWKQMRPHQWIKNLLVFLPALAGHKIFLENLLAGFYAFLGFSLAASFVYVVNDLLDLKSDRNHHSKKNRPFASGHLPIKWGLLLLSTLLMGTVLLSTTLPPEFLLWVIGYLVLNLAYSLYLKQSVVVDILILSMMYTLRIFAGSAATSVPVSEWLLSFSTLFFFSLACIKRYTEIIRSKNKITLDGRGYRQIDGNMVQVLGVGAGLISVLIIILYLQSTDVRALYPRPQSLWFATPVLLFWISRIWILANRDEVHDDPVVFAVKDKMSWLCLLLLAIVFGAAT